MATFNKKTARKSNYTDRLKSLTALENAVLGSLMGFAIGDSVGAFMALQTEDLNKMIPIALLMNGGGTFNLAPGQGTDETEIMLSAAYGLLESGKKYNQNLMGEKYL